jgi:hypothetical protein
MIEGYSRSTKCRKKELRMGWVSIETEENELVGNIRRT